MATIPIDYFSSLAPSGTVVAHASATPPDGWLLCDGSAVSRTVYANLFASIGTTWGSGNGSTTFHIPDLRGRFLRGRDSGTARDPNAGTRTASNSGGATGDNVGSVQGHSFQTHGHRALGSGIVDNDCRGLTAADAGGIGTVNQSGGEAYSLTRALSGTRWIELSEATGGNSEASSGESRPVNASINYIIKL